jgi:hypothetical protein
MARDKNIAARVFIKVSTSKAKNKEKVNLF